MLNFIQRKSPSWDIKRILSCFHKRKIVGTPTTAYYDQYCSQVRHVRYGISNRILLPLSLPWQRAFPGTLFTPPRFSMGISLLAIPFLVCIYYTFIEDFISIIKKKLGPHKTFKFFWGWKQRMIIVMKCLKWNTAWFKQHTRYWNGHIWTETKIFRANGNFPIIFQAEEISIYPTARPQFWLSAPTL